MKKANLAKILLWTFFTSNIISFLAIIIIQKNTRHENVDYEHLCDMSGIAYLIGVGFNTLLSLLSLTIFLNAYKTIRKTFWFSFASFFALPLIVTVYLEITIGDEISLFSLPFIAVLALFFYRFRKSVIQQNDITPPNQS